MIPPGSDGKATVNGSTRDMHRIESAAPAWGQFEMLVAHLSDGVTVQDTSGKLVYANAAGARLSGYATPAELLAAPVSDFAERFEVLSADGVPLRLNDLPGRRALQGTAADAMLRVRERATDIERWSEVRAYPVRADAEAGSDVVFVVNIFRDVTEDVRQRHLVDEQAQELEEQTAQAQAMAEELQQANEDLADALRITEEARRREEYLSQATAILASSLDYEATLQRVAEQAVPALADWCSVDILSPSGDIVQLAVAHVDPAKVKWAKELRVKTPPDATATTGVPNVLRTGEAELYADISDELLVRTSRDEEELAIMRAIGFSSALIVPLRGSAAALGALTMVWAESGKHYSQDDLSFARELGRRAGIAIEHASLHRDALAARAEAEAARAASEVRSEWLAALQRLTAALSRCLEPSEVWVVAPRKGATEFRADSAYLAMLDSARSHLSLVGTHGLTEDVTRRYQDVPVDAPVPSAQCVRSGEPVLVHNDAEFAERFPELTAVRRDTGSQATAAIPVRVGGSVIGAMVFSYRTPQEFSTDFVNAAGTFAKEIGQASDRTRTRAELASAKLAADAANAAKSTFLATMSHELRTPINAILGFGELMREGVAGPTTTTQAEYLNRIRKSTQHLLELINDVLDLAKIEAGGLELTWEQSRAVDAARDSAEVVEVVARGRGLTFDWRCAEGITYKGDPRRVRQILLNLLSNAVKFTARGGRVTLTCRATPNDSGNPSVEFIVEDTGIGIATGETERIFDAFAQGERVYTREHGGTGLGLTISRRLARMMGGDVTVVSTPGKGSRFVFTCPA